MLTMRNQSTHMAAPSAEHNYRRLRQLDILSLILLGVMAALAIWNLLALGSMFSSEIPDLADIGVISEHPSSRIMTAVALFAFAVVIFKEWKYGERTLGVMYLLVPMLFLGLIPTVSAELQPNPRDKMIEFTLVRCAPGGIVNGELANNEACEVADVAIEDIYLSDANPAGGDFELHPAIDSNQGSGRWKVTGVGNYRVYFMVKQESLEACNGSTFAARPQDTDIQQHHCIEHDGAAWSVHSMVTSYMGEGWLSVYQQLP